MYLTSTCNWDGLVGAGTLRCWPLTNLNRLCVIFIFLQNTKLCFAVLKSVSVLWLLRSSRWPKGQSGPLTDIRGCRHSGFRHSGFSPRGSDVRGSDIRGPLFWTLGFRTFGVLENGRSGLNPERLKMNPVSLNPERPKISPESLNPERPKTPNVRKWTPNV